MKQSAKKVRARKINDLSKYYAELEGRRIDGEEVQPEDVQGIPIPIEDYSVPTEVEVEEHLQYVCEELYSRFKARIKPPKLILQAVKVFNKNDSFDWYNKEEEVEEEVEDWEVDGLSGHSTTTPCPPSNLAKAELILDKLFELSPEFFQKRKEIITEGYVEFVKIASEIEHEKSLEFKYQVFKKKCSDQLKARRFSLFFEWLQLKSFSEAYAETVGSIMVISTGKGKQVQRQNLGKNICLNFNLPPMHILNQEFVPEIAEEVVKTKVLRFFRKLEVMRPSLIKKLLNENLSASLHNFRKDKEKMRLPVQLFRKDES